HVPYHPRRDRHRPHQVPTRPPNRARPLPPLRGRTHPPPSPIRHLTTVKPHENSTEEPQHRRSESVRPARAGMNRHRPGGNAVTACPPRASGDEPSAIAGEQRRIASAPRERG